MGKDEKTKLDDVILERVSGGAHKDADEFGQKKAEFEKAWDLLGMDGKGFSGMRMATLFDDWELAGYKPSAVAFLKSQDL